MVPDHRGPVVFVAVFTLVGMVQVHQRVRTRLFLFSIREALPQRANAHIILLDLRADLCLVPAAFPVSPIGVVRVLICNIRRTLAFPFHLVLKPRLPLRWRLGPERVILRPGRRVRRARELSCF